MVARRKALINKAAAAGGTETNDLSAAVTWAETLEVRSDSDDTDARAILDYKNQSDDVTRARVGFTNGTETFYIKNQITGGKVTGTFVKSGGTAVTFMDMNPNSSCSLRSQNNFALYTGNGSTAYAFLAYEGDRFQTYFDAVSVTRTETRANGGLEVYNSATASGWERVLTVSDGGTSGGNNTMQLPTYTSTEILNKYDALNFNAGKEQGGMIYDTTLDQPLWAAGGADTDVWMDAQGATIHTPV